MDDNEIHKNHRQRLRKRLFTNPDSLSKYELLELLLFFAVPRRNVNPDAHRLLNKYGSLKNILHANAEDLAQVDGIGEIAAAYLSALGKALDVIEVEKQDDTKIYSFENVKSYFIRMIGSQPTESFCAVYLAKNGRILLREVYTCNKSDSVEIDVAPFMRAFALVKPHAVVVAHNHPSGNVNPSPEDDSATEKMAMLFSLSNVKLYDHIIVGSSDVFSYRMDGRIDKIIQSVNLRCKGL